MFSKKKLTLLPPSFSSFTDLKAFQFCCGESSQEGWWTLKYTEIQLFFLLAFPFTIALKISVNILDNKKPSVLHSLETSKIGEVVISLIAWQQICNLVTWTGNLPSLSDTICYPWAAVSSEAYLLQHGAPPFKSTSCRQQCLLPFLPRWLFHVPSLFPLPCPAVFLSTFAMVATGSCHWSFGVQKIFTLELEPCGTGCGQLSWTIFG